MNTEQTFSTTEQKSTLDLVGNSLVPILSKDRLTSSTKMNRSLSVFPGWNNQNMCDPHGYPSSRRKSGLYYLHPGACHLPWHVRRKEGRLQGPWVVQTRGSGNHETYGQSAKSELGRTSQNHKACPNDCSSISRVRGRHRWIQRVAFCTWCQHLQPI